jgi:hypothetical protein
MGRRFPSPWRAETVPGGYTVGDANGTRRLRLRKSDKSRRLGKHMTLEQARKMALNIAKLRPGNVRRKQLIRRRRPCSKNCQTLFLAGGTDGSALDERARRQ